MTTTISYTSAREGAIPPRVTGSQLAHKHLSKLERARIAGSILDGTTQLVGLTKTQVCSVCQVSRRYVSQTRQPQAQGVLQLEAAE
jgi:hypothetical protein